MNTLFYGAAVCLLYFNAANALQCYHTVSVQTMGQDFGNHHVKMDCKENSVCMLAEVHLSVGYTPATLYSGFCFPKSEVDTTACKDVLANLGQVNAVGPGNKKVDTCKLSFCDNDFCNDMDGPSLPEHVPTEKLEGEPVECYAIQKTTTSLGVGNKNQVSKITCHAGASCYISKATAGARANYRSFSIDIITGGCKLASLCDYDECKWVQSDIKGMMPASLNIDINVKNCQSACCSGNSCNDVNSRIETSTQTTNTKKIAPQDDSDDQYVYDDDIRSESRSDSSSVSGLSYPVIVAIGSVVSVLVVAALVIIRLSCKRTGTSVPFKPLGSDNLSIKS